MTKQELQEMINESVARALNTSVLTEDVIVTKEQADYDQAVALMEASFEVLDEKTQTKTKSTINKEALIKKVAKVWEEAYDDALDDMSPAQAKAYADKVVKEKFGVELVDKLNKAEGNGQNIFKNVSGRIRSVDPKKAAIAVAATAVITAGIAAGVVAAKKKKKAKEDAEK